MPAAHYSPLARIRGIQAPDNHNYFEPSTIVASLRKCDVDDWVYSVPSNCSISSSIHAQETWPTKYPDCKGKSQSPLHLRFLQSTYKDMPPINFFNYDTEMVLTVEVKGANLFVSPTNSRVAVYGGPLLVEYTFVLGVFHFGTGSGQGAEHHIDEQNNAAELQLIHYTETNIDIDCLKEVNGLLALVILFKETENNNTVLSGFMKAVRELHVPGTNETSPKASSAVPKFFMSYFTPASTENYYLYSGSLTFPPCTERVINVVLSRSVEIGKDQLAELRKLKWRFQTQPCSSATVAGNVRKLVASTTGAETRAVYRNFRFMTRQGATAPAAPSAVALAVIAVLLAAEAAATPPNTAWPLP
ncbi:carbonic anhydrase 2-like [Dermacentor andersoni]|uniref:carbonic anhydrase 2-like n=1 Tax=Dermacentor andersoni TaxID=34620 RepID=UPI002417D513|nr:carbonic anhydrase 2-like [Dermacentor andersoni]